MSKNSCQAVRILKTLNKDKDNSGNKRGMQNKIMGLLKSPLITPISCFTFTAPQGLTWTRQWHPTPVLLPGKSHGQRSLVGCSPWGRKESDTTERLHFHFLLSCIGEGNGNPLQCSCLENPRDREAWWAAVCGVAESQTRLKRLSSSSSSSSMGLTHAKWVSSLPDRKNQRMLFFF